MSGKRFLSAVLLTASLPGARGQEQKPPADPQNQSSALPDGPVLPLEQFQLPQLLPDAIAVPLFPFQESDIKFSLDRMAAKLEDNRHESMVLTAYPDPVTKLPLIGAGFSLRIPKTPPHVIGDPADPFQFAGKARIEPDSQSLWVAAGLKREDLDKILEQFDMRMKQLHADKARPGTIARMFSAKIKNGEFGPDIVMGDARKLTRISTEQAAYNAQFYCPGVFDKMTESQQEAMAHLVYQMGPHLEGFERFRGTLESWSPEMENSKEHTRKFWQEVQKSLTDSQWFRKYNGTNRNGRATAVTAMFNPDYDSDRPDIAERQLRAILQGGTHSHAHMVAQTRQADKGARHHGPQHRKPGTAHRA